MLLSIHIKVLPRAEKEGQKRMLNVLIATRKGILRADCWAKGGEKEGQGLKMKGKVKMKAKEVTAKEKVEEKMEAWIVSLAVIDESQKSFDKTNLSCGFNSSNDWFDEMDSLPDLQPVSNSDDSEMEETNLLENLDDMDSLPDLQSVSNSKIDKKDLLESFGKEYIIPSIHSSPLNNPDTCSEVFDGLDSPSKEFEYVPMKEEAYVMTYKANVL